MTPDEEREYGARVDDIRESMLDSLRAGDDFGDVLSQALGQAATRLGSVEALVESRPGSREADLVRRLAVQYAQTPDSPFADPDLTNVRRIGRPR